MLRKRDLIDARAGLIAVVIGLYCRYALAMDFRFAGCVDGLALGCLTAFAASRFAIPDRAKLYLVAAGIALVLIALYRFPYQLEDRELGTDLISAGTALAMLGATFTPRAPRYSIGGRSYEIYLLGVPVMLLLGDAAKGTILRDPTMAAWRSCSHALCFVLLAAAELSGRLITEPANRFIRSHFDSELGSGLPDNLAPSEIA